MVGDEGVAVAGVPVAEVVFARPDEDLAVDF